MTHYDHLTIVLTEYHHYRLKFPQSMKVCSSKLKAYTFLTDLIPVKPSKHFENSYLQLIEYCHFLDNCIYH
jgi:hypothetical protein